MKPSRGVTEAELAQNAPLVSAELRNPSPKKLSGRCFCRSLPARILTRVRCSCVNNPLDDLLDRMQILSLKTFRRRISQRVNFISVFTYYRIH